MRHSVNVSMKLAKTVGDYCKRNLMTAAYTIVLVGLSHALSRNSCLLDSKQSHVHPLMTQNLFRYRLRHYNTHTIWLHKVHTKYYICGFGSHLQLHAITQTEWCAQARLPRVRRLERCVTEV